MPDIGPALADVIRATDYPAADLWIMSDNLDTLSAMRRQIPGAELVHLIFQLPSGAAAQQDLVRQQLAVHASRVALSLAVPDVVYMTVARRAGLRVLFWTADLPLDDFEMDGLTADGVITDKPLIWLDWAARSKGK